MNFEGLYQVVVLALAIAAISVTTAKSRIFASARSWINERNEWLGELASCQYCTSHWLALVFVAIYRPVIIKQWIIVDLLVSLFSMVAIAAVISGLIIKLATFQGNDNPPDKENGDTNRFNNMNNAQRPGRPR
jgi:hypothetical protein